MNERDVDAPDLGHGPSDQASAGGAAEVPKGSRLWQLLATRNPEALHPSADPD
jgi:hypothetical protein